VFNVCELNSEADMMVLYTTFRSCRYQSISSSLSFFHKRQQLEGLPLRTVLPSASTTLRSLTSGAHKLVVLSNTHAGAPTTVVPSSGTEEGSSADSGHRTRYESKPFLLSRFSFVCVYEKTWILHLMFSYVMGEYLLSAARQRKLKLLVGASNYETCCTRQVEYRLLTKRCTANNGN
jgi:hypothetical protein